MFLSTAYALFIAPLEMVMRTVLELLLQWTHSPLFALIGVSVTVSLGALPFYHLAEQWQEKERAVRESMAPKITVFSEVFTGSVRDAYIRTLYRQYGYHPIYSLRSVAGLLMQIPFFFAAYHLLSHYEPFEGLSAWVFADLHAPDKLLSIGSVSINILPFVMTAINIGSVLLYSSKTTKKESVQLYGMAFVFLVLLYNSPSGLLFYWTWNNLFSLLKNAVYRLLFRQGNITSSKSEHFHEKNIEFFGVAFFAFLAATVLFLPFVSAPLSLLASGMAEDFSGTLSHYLSYSLSWASLLFFLSVTLYFYLSIRGRKVLFLLFFFLLVVFVADISVFSRGYGDMSNFMFEEGLVTSVPMIFVDFAVLLFALLISLFVVLRYRYSEKGVRFAVSVVFVTVFLFSFHQGYLFEQKRDIAISEQGNQLSAPFIFSRTKKNVLVVMLDRFMGGYIPTILSFMPELKDEFDGFVWYSHMLSSGSYTISGEPPIMGGWDYYVGNVNHTRQNVPLKTKLDESVRVMPYNFKKAGFRCSLFVTLSRWWNRRNTQYMEGVRTADLTKRCQPIWMKRHNHTIYDRLVLKKMALFGLFRVLPRSVRPFVYDGGAWHLNAEEYSSSESRTAEKKGAKPKKDPLFVRFHEKNKGRILRTIKYWSVLDMLPELSVADADAPPQFYYMTNDLTHEPYAVNRFFDIQIDGNIAYPRKIYNKFAKSINATKHLYTDAAALKLVAKWLRWMKENGVYDNTRIIFVSDHGRALHDPMFGRRQHIPRSKKRTRGSLFHNLLLVKDFNAHGPLREQKTPLMSNADVPAIALEGIVDGVNPYTGHPLKIKIDKFPFFVYDTQWRIEKQHKYRYNIKSGFSVNKEPIFDLRNWSVLPPDKW